MEKIIARDVGAEGLETLSAVFYRHVKTDDLIGPMYPAEDFAGAEKRLADFLKFRLLGDETYLVERGHPRLRMRHTPFSIGQAESDRWVSLMESAMAECGVSTAARAALSPFFRNVADFMQNR